MHTQREQKTLQSCFFYNDTATTEIYTLSLHDALPISLHEDGGADVVTRGRVVEQLVEQVSCARPVPEMVVGIHDGQVGFQDLLVHLGEPGFADRDMR